MKISIGMRLRNGPWGGGNQFGNALADYLKRAGHEVIFDLHDSDIDVILLAVVVPDLDIYAYGDAEIFHYLRRVNPEAIVVHRVNECDERKGTHTINRMLRRAMLCADHVVFVSSWLRSLHLAQGMHPISDSVILNGSDRSIFHSSGYHPWDRRGPLRIVTHHWGAGWLKGFDIYQRLDEMLAQVAWQDRIQFTYVGNLPQGFRFRHATHKPPLHGVALADELRSHHVYLTASQFEPGGNHQNEGANCGLPLLYRQHASMPEYCDGFGIGFTSESFVSTLGEMTETYEQWLPVIHDFPYSAEKTARQYLDLFQYLLANRQEVLERRSITHYWRWRYSPIRALQKLIP